MDAGPMLDAAVLELPGWRQLDAEVPVSSRDEAVRELFAAFYGRLTGWLTRLVGDDELAHDMATEAFIRLVARWGTVSEPRAWLYMTAGNLARDHWRKSGRERIAYAKVGARLAEASPEVDLAAQVTVRQLVLALPDRLRLPVLLHYYADLPVAQVAAVLGKAEGSVKRALFDARAVMAQQLEQTR